MRPRAASSSARSCAARLVASYAECGSVAERYVSSSVAAPVGPRAAVELTNTASAPRAAAASRTLRVPSTLVRVISPGSRGPNSYIAAAWNTTSIPSIARTTDAASVTSPTASSTGNPASRRRSLVGRTRTRTSSPRAHSMCATCEPRNPVAPVTRYLIALTNTLLRPWYPIGEAGRIARAWKVGPGRASNSKTCVSPLGVPDAPVSAPRRALAGRRSSCSSWCWGPRAGSTRRFRLTFVPCRFRRPRPLRRRLRPALAPAPAV